MKASYFILAESIGFLSDGRACIFGGESNTVRTTKLPAIFSSSVLAKLLLFPDEPLEGHTFSIKVLDPDGESAKGGESYKINTSRNDQCPDDPSIALLNATLNLTLTQPGRYLVTLVVDGIEALDAPLYVNGPESDEPASNQQDG